MSTFLSQPTADDGELFIFPLAYRAWDFSEEAKGVRWQEQGVSVGTQPQYYTHILYPLVCPDQMLVYKQIPIAHVIGFRLLTYKQHGTDAGSHTAQEFQKATPVNI